MQFDDAMRSTDKEWRCRVDEMKRACDASLLRESELKRSIELESLRRRESDAALKESRESLAQAQEMLRDSNWRGDDLQGQVDALIQARDMLAIEHKAAHERTKASNERLLSEVSTTNRTLEAEAARLQDEIARARSAHAVDLQRLQVLCLFVVILPVLFPIIFSTLSNHHVCRRFTLELLMTPASGTVG